MAGSPKDVHYQLRFMGRPTNTRTHQLQLLRHAIEMLPGVQGVFVSIVNSCTRKSWVLVAEEVVERMHPAVHPALPL